LNTENQVKIDLTSLGFYFDKPELFNDGIQCILYQVKTNIGLSRRTLLNLQKKGIRFFSLILTNPHDGLSTATILFSRKI
jgi:hypothetical protein